MAGIDLHYVRCVRNGENKASLFVGRVYRSLPISAQEERSGMLRIVDNEGEDYLYPADWFEAIPMRDLLADQSDALTVHLNPLTKVAVRDLANKRGITMSALVREWIDEQLDLPEVTEQR
jgi:hypothetical protein